MPGDEVVKDVPDWMLGNIAVLWDRFESDYGLFLSKIEPMVKASFPDDGKFGRIMGAIRERFYNRSVVSPPEWEEEEGVEGIFRNPREGERLTTREFHPEGWMNAERAGKLRLPTEKMSRLLGFSDEEVVEDIQENALRILDVCNNPLEGGAEWGNNRQGLVFGMVQSGKTANMLSLISLSMRAGYRLFVILSGDKDSLRRQTQQRVNEAFGLEGGVNRTRKIRYSDDQETFPCYIHSPTHKSDFKRIEETNYAANFRFSDRIAREEDWCTIIVIKKETNHLNALVDQIKEFESAWTGLSAEGDMGEMFPTLIIDDEADYASLNKPKKNKPSPIFSDISNLRKAIKHNCFAAYTATPQGCLLAAEDPVGYPSDFWWMIEPFYTIDENTGEKRNRTYLGVWEVFRSYDTHLLHSMGDDEWPHHEKDAISGWKSMGIRVPAGRNGSPPERRNQPAKDLQLIEEGFLDGIISGKRDPLPSVRKAMMDYLITCGVRWWRNWIATGKMDKPSTEIIEAEKDYKHHSMMVHLSLKQPCHKKIRTMMEELWPVVKEDFEDFDPEESPDDHPFGNRWRKQKERSYFLIEGRPNLPYAEIKWFISRCIEITEKPIFNPETTPLSTYEGDPWIYMINSVQNQGMKLDYRPDSAFKARAKKAAIAVGGNILSRGLTLEGLSVSVYARSASDEKQDTDLQRCRWLGHKMLEIDLISIHLHDNAREVFRDIAIANEKLRKQLKIALHNFHTPKQAIILLYNSPYTTPTSHSRGAKKTKGMGFSGKMVSLSSPSFKVDDIIANQKILDRFKRKWTKYDEEHKTWIARNYPLRETIKLLRKFKCEKGALTVSFKELADYLDSWYKENLKGDFPSPPNVNIAIKKPGKRQRRMRLTDKPGSIQEAIDNAKTQFDTIPRGRDQNGPFRGDAFIDKPKSWHEKWYKKGEEPEKMRAPGEDLLIVIYPLESNYIRQAWYDKSNLVVGSEEATKNPDGVRTTVKEGNISGIYLPKKHPLYVPGNEDVLTYAAWVPSGGPMQDAWYNKLVSYDDPKQVGMDVTEEEE